ncbi:MAG TPA: peptidoglycan-binding domain-containing protein [Devosiaceae bacterium]
MTAATISHLPLAVGGAVASSAGRVGLWAIARFARAPLAYSGIFAMTTLSVMAASNALYHQAHRHPAPLFAPAATQQSAELTPVRQVQPPTRPRTQPARPTYVSTPVVTQETTGSLPDTADTGDSVGNSQVFAVQQKLMAMQLFEGKVDGYYGPMTASAIRKFETQTGRQPEGALSRDVVDAILNTPVTGPMSALTRPLQPEPAPLPPAAQPVQMAAADVQPNMYVAPPEAQAQPQQADVIPPLVFGQQAQQQQAPVLVAQQVQSGPEDVLDDVADGAAGAFDALVSTVQGGTHQQSSVRGTPQPQANAPIPPARLIQASAPAVQPAMQPITENLSADPSDDPALVARVQRGLASLGFLAGTVDGVPGEATAKAIRNFEVYYNYSVTGKVSPQLVGMLQDAGAVL